VSDTRILPVAACFVKYINPIFYWLHSLHGGGDAAVQQRRARLGQLISNGTDDYGNRLSPWEIGFLIHAFGDAYAHTYTSRSGLNAYGWPFGHLWSGHKPDIIASNREQYKTYVRELYRALGGCNEAGNELLQRLMVRADDSEEDPTAEAIWYGLFARRYAGYVRYYQPTDNFNIDRSMDTPSPSEVSDLMGIIPEATSEADD
jgi:hypothetical protein